MESDGQFCAEHEKIREELAAPSDVPLCMKPKGLDSEIALRMLMEQEELERAKKADEEFTVEMSKRMLEVAKELGINPVHAMDAWAAPNDGKHLLGGLEKQVEDHIKQWLDKSGPGQLFGINRSDPPVRFSDSFKSEVEHIAGECTELEQELFKTDPEVIEYAKLKAETPERYENTLCTMYSRACEGHAPEKAWMHRATNRMREIMNRRAYR